MLSNVEAGYHLQYPEFQSIRGKTVVIIGDSAGIGRATAALLAGYGARIFFAARSSAELSSALAAVEQEGGEWDGTVVDLSRPGELALLFDLVHRRLGRMDILINPPATEVEDLQNQCMQESIHWMQPGARIINIGLPQLLQMPDKLAEREITAALRREAKNNGIKVTSIEPGLSDYRNLTPVVDAFSASDVAHCVYDALVQPNSMDLIFISGEFQGPVL